MSPTLSLRRSSKTDPEPDVDQIEDLEDLPPVADGRHQTTSALGAKVTLFTTIEGGRAACAGMRHDGLETYSLQSLHGELAT